MQAGEKVSNYFTAKFALLDAYQATTGVYNPYDPSKNLGGLARPLSLIAKHKAESNLDHMWVAKVERFARSGAYEVFGLSLADAFKMPMWKLDQMLEVADKIRKEKNKAMSSVHAELENLNKGKF